MDSSGSNPVNLTKGRMNAMSADWSPDKSKIVFESVDTYLQGNPVCGVHTISADGSSVKRISPGASSRHFPAWSPDGSKIANCKYMAALKETGRKGYFQLFTFSQDGAEDVPVTFSQTTSYHLLPRWFPDSKRIAFLNYDIRIWEIYVGDIITGDASKYNIECNTRYTSFMPWFSISPDGTRIAYTHDFSRDYWHTGRELFLFDINTGEAIQLTRNDYADDNPCFSPDGNKILFSSFGNTEETSGMFIMDIDGNNIKKIPSNYGDMPMKWR